MTISKPVKIIAIIAGAVLLLWGAWYSGHASKVSPQPAVGNQAPPPEKTYIACGSGQCVKTDNINFQGTCLVTAEQEVMCGAFSVVKNPNKK